MTNTPCFSDLGKKANDLFSKDFKTGICNFEFKSKTCTGADIKATGLHDQAVNLFDSAFEYKTKIACGMLTKLRVDSKWNLTNEVEISDRIVRNLKQTAIVQLRSDEILKTFSLKNCHASSRHNVELDLHFKEACPTTIANLVLGPASVNIPLYLGFTGTMEPKNPKPTKLAAVAFHKYKDLHLLVGVDKKKNIDFSAFHATSMADIAFKIGWNYIDKTIKSQFGFLYKPSSATFLKAKIDNKVNIGLAYGVKITEGCNLIFSSQIDGKNTHDGHKFGFTVEAVA